jgi:putative acetyltransferase
MDPAISILTMDDYDEAVAFWRSQEGIALNESDEREPMSRFLLRNPGMSLIARRASGEVVAAVLCGHDGRRGYLHHLAVDRAHRRRGLGRALVERCLAKLAAAGVPKCNVFLFNDNIEGRRFWERLGYKSVTWIPMQRVIEKGI